ncbi:MAG: hypothetical protein ACRCZ0_11260 [Cetobacterium sp.]
MNVVGFGFKSGKSFANIQFNSGNIIPAYFDHEGVELWAGCPHEVVEKVKKFLLSKEIFDKSNLFYNILPEDLKWIGKKVSNSLLDLDNGFKTFHNFEYVKSFKFNGFGGKNYVKNV